MSEEQRGAKEKICPEGMIHKDGECVMPDVTFEAFVLSLNTAALFHMGELADPATGKKQKDLMLARHHRYAEPPAGEDTRQPERGRGGPA